MSDLTTQALATAPPSTDRSPARPGAFVGDYTIDSFVARGGFALVYRAHSRVDGSIAAIKVLHADLCGTDNALARFFREAEVLARLEHPNIVKIFGAGEAEERPFIVMEWLDGHTLADELVRRSRFSLDELLGVMEELCSALALVHAAGIVHRDLKPSNVVVVPKGDWFQTKLVDFGIARLVGEGPGSEAGRMGLTITGTVIGTPTYMAPEQLLGQKVNEKSDIYAIGVISFELLVGHAPFQADGHTEVTEQHLFIAAPRVSSFVAVPAGVDAAIGRCLAKRPADRPTTILEFLDELREAIRGPSQAASVEQRTNIVGIHVEVAFDGPDDALDDVLLEKLDTALLHAEQLLAAAGLEVIQAAGTAILGSMQLPLGSRARGIRDSVLRLALDLRDELERDLPTDDVTFSVAVHVAAELDILRDPRWTSRIPRRVVFATDSVIEGLEGGFDVAPSLDNPQLHRIIRSRNA